MATFHRTRRFILILVGTAILGAGAVVPAAMADGATPVSGVALSPADCNRAA